MFFGTVCFWSDLSKWLHQVVLGNSERRLVSSYSSALIFESNNETQRVLIYVTNTKMIEDLHHAVKHATQIAAGILCISNSYLASLMDRVFRSERLAVFCNHRITTPQCCLLPRMSMMTSECYHRPAGLHSLGTADEAAGSRSRSIVPNGSSTNLTAQPRRCRDNSEWCGSCSGGAH